MSDLISRQEVIEHLKKRLYETALNNYPDYSYYEEIADNRVDTWLNELPSAQPEPCKDAVSRADVVDMLEMFPFTEYSEYETAIEVVKRLPSAQPEIVRCKDCKHRGSYWGNCRLLEKKYHQGVLVDGDDFCSKAERRTDG